jgi:hypothetical protein
MNRSISISTSVFAAIWANRQAGEETENAILDRLLGCGSEPAETELPKTNSPNGIGFSDTRNSVYFAEGFEIFRHYKRNEYKAIARNGFWVRTDNGKKYESLNQLNASIAAGAENVWNGNWKYLSTSGSVRSIGELRK